MQESQVQSLDLEDFPGKGNGYPLQYSCLESPINRGAWVGFSPWGCRIEHDWTTNTFTFLFMARVSNILCLTVIFIEKNYRNIYIQFFRYTKISLFLYSLSNLQLIVVNTSHHYYLFLVCFIYSIIIIWSHKKCVCTCCIENIKFLRAVSLALYPLIDTHCWKSVTW